MWVKRKPSPFVQSTAATASLSSACLSLQTASDAEVCPKREETRMRFDLYRWTLALRTRLLHAVGATRYAFRRRLTVGPLQRPSLRDPRVGAPCGPEPPGLFLVLAGAAPLALLRGSTACSLDRAPAPSASAGTRNQTRASSRPVHPPVHRAT